LVQAACGELAPPILIAEAPAVTYTEAIQPLFESRCVSCHNAQQRTGNYALDSWRGLLGSGTDLERNARPGDGNSRLLTIFGEQAHRQLLDEQELARLTSWVTHDQMAYFRTDYHPPGWLDPTDRMSRDFHGGDLRARKWDTSTCRKCHGADLRGGLSSKSCFDCHAEGPFGCTTCHGSDDSAGQPIPDLAWQLEPSLALGVGAHQAHAAPKYFAAIACDQCHRVPRSVADAGHLFDDPAPLSTDFRAEVIFGAKAALGGLKPKYTRTQQGGTCQVYCHGATLKQLETKQLPSWVSNTGGATCATCHPTPMIGLGGLDCANCHQQSVERCTPGVEGCTSLAATVAVRFKDPTLHLDGVAPTGRSGAEGTCYGCHGTAASNGAPAPDLAGNSSISAAGVGLHEVHLRDGPLRKALTCDTCHHVPYAIDAPGHLDSGPPAEVVFNDLASGKLRDPETTVLATWDAKTRTCNNVYCHSRAQGKQGNSWRWNEKLADGLHCDSCHKGKPEYPLYYCKTCHLTAYKDGELNPETHMNGKMDWSL
jgi:predicted CxxxxCH...CXXCH cytochrome family protein